MLSFFSGIRFSLLAVVVAIGFSTPVHAKKLAGVSMADKIDAAGKTLVLNGVGLREATFLKVDVYVAGLYLESKSNSSSTIINSDGPKRLVLKFVRDVERHKLTDAMKEGFEKNGRSSGKLAAKIDTLNGYLAEMKVGNQMSFDFLPDGNTKVFVNKKLKGIIAGKDFSKGLLAIWLGPNPPNAGLKRGLLGK